MPRAMPQDRSIKSRAIQPQGSEFGGLYYLVPNPVWHKDQKPILYKLCRLTLREVRPVCRAAEGRST